MKRFFFLCSSLVVTTCSSVLPPLYETIAEYKALLESPQLGEKLSSGEPIVSITREAEGFLLTTTRSTLRVKVHYMPQNRPGPSQFTLQFRESQSLGSTPI